MKILSKLKSSQGFFSKLLPSSDSRFAKFLKKVNWKSCIYVVSTVLTSTVVTLVVLYSPIGSRVIRDYIHRNPRAIIDSIQEMDRMEREKNEEEAKNSAKKLAETIRYDSSAPVVGNKNGKHVIIEFYDYACGYCKKVAKEVKTVLEQRNDVMFILQDFPILSVSSLNVSKASLFVAKKYPMKMEQFHFALMDAATTDEATVKSIAKNLGIPPSEIEKAMASSEYDGSLRENYNRAAQIKANGTPVFIIDGKLFMGYVSAAQMIDAMDGKL